MTKETCIDHSCYNHVIELSQRDRNTDEKLFRAIDQFLNIVSSYLQNILLRKLGTSPPVTSLKSFPVTDADHEIATSCLH